MDHSFLSYTPLSELHEAGLFFIKLALCAVGSVVFLVLASITVVSIIRTFIHPLAGVPGPKLAALSNIWQAYYARNGRMLELGKTLHAKYGPAVRVGPNEVWFNSVEAFKIIYGQSCRVSDCLRNYRRDNLGSK